MVVRAGGVLLALAFYIYTVIDVARTPKSSTRTLPKYVWLIIAILLPIIGGVFWLFFGRVWPEAGFRSNRRSPRAPDDDPKFLRALEERAWSDKMRRRREQNP